MRLLGNILWHIPFLGFVSAIIAFVIGLLLTLTVVAAPIGIGLMELGKFLLWPFGKTMISKNDLEIEQNSAWQAYQIIVMILYMPIGILLLLLGIVQTVFLFLSIVGIPAAIVVAKSLGTYLNPVNKKCVHYAVGDEIERIKAQKEIKKFTK